MGSLVSNLFLPLLLTLSACPDYRVALVSWILAMNTLPQNFDRVVLNLSSCLILPLSSMISSMPSHPPYRSAWRDLRVQFIFLFATGCPLTFSHFCQPNFPVRPDPGSPRAPTVLPAPINCLMLVPSTLLSSYNNFAPSGLLPSLTGLRMSGFTGCTISFRAEHFCTASCHPPSLLLSALFARCLSRRKNIFFLLALEKSFKVI
ncbi:hypothetical protein PHYBLDRAFT_71284 [Phycomyces blakesleeanus NRRL 1555(-)]|uniref:Secreted protein n=1 Tax=Phycomyces blakesleeanus (strain ATCC 8743b / DSM 1359 / FGSC 10004 / NBRC 33097 / NRRL 1555) TaxID=763407 RepID=A0A162N8N1_PHYB8|nr:hypothetical protein PHYBLDRAFT_71284 [Phycomyces blakesleeanus NRRL 1555(-)]OAD72128.1 hypothetical protein PHYBLDRAFT_71284 [Phycomyces blakesleeanus NRRL 1555(-)]|eukprot:XP_018290168.1 hypothetical protein PHYBLDRAFT_71284 [Phycomyces blakesleeanus NRRL 1555(-)]